MAVASAATRRPGPRSCRRSGFGNAEPCPRRILDDRTAASDAAARHAGPRRGRRTRPDALGRAEPRGGGGRDHIKAERCDHGDAARRVVLSGDTHAIEAGLRGVVAGLSDEATVLARR